MERSFGTGLVFDRTISNQSENVNVCIPSTECHVEIQKALRPCCSYQHLAEVSEDL